MSDQELLDRIVSRKDILGGKPIVKGTRLSVEHVLNLLAHGSTVGDILDEYKGLSTEDIQACLLFATKFLGDTAFAPLEQGNP